jgi:hypothetical protein
MMSTSFRCLSQRGIALPLGWRRYEDIGLLPIVTLES